MSILAQPRRKQRISIDPQNIAWKNDDEKFGKKLMVKMGWSEGKGLGLNEQGMSNNLKLKANHTAKGLGCEHTYDTTWISHHDDFSNLLESLNKNKSSEEVKCSDGKQTKKSLEESSKSSKARIHYHKFTRGKDLSRFSSNDISSITGVGLSRKRKHPSEPEGTEDLEEEPKKKAKKEKKENRDVEADTGFGDKTSVSQVSVSDYFAEKMRKMKEKAAAAKQTSVVQNTEQSKEDENVPSEVEEEERKMRKQKRKEEKRRLKEEARLFAEAQVEIENEKEIVADDYQIVEESKEERKQRKRENKLRKLVEGKKNEA